MTEAEIAKALAGFNRDFRIVPTSLFNWPRSKAADKKPTGDCQNYAASVKDILDVKFPRAVVIRCWSKPGLPRHAVLWVRGRGFIDSTTRHFRKTPWPCIPAWPVGTPAILGVAYAASQWWRFFG